MSPTAMYPCGPGLMTAAHLLLRCPLTDGSKACSPVGFDPCKGDTVCQPSGSDTVKAFVGVDSVNG